MTAHASKPLVPEVLPLVQAYYAKPGHEAGGNLHIVLDDGNVDHGSVEYCFARCLQEDDRDGAALAAKLMEMSYTQRLKLYRHPKKRHP